MENFNQNNDQKTNQNLNQKLVIEQSPPLKGRVRVGGSKNAVLPIMAASILAEGRSVVKEVPDLSDVAHMELLLKHLGVSISRDIGAGVIALEPAALGSARDPGERPMEIPYKLASAMRASFMIAGPLLARTGGARIPLPGGCAIGSRPVDLHLKGFAALGARIQSEHGFVNMSAGRLKGADIYLDFPSVGATENIMMAATLAEGQTVIENCATEPEVVDLAGFLNMCGACVRGAGTDTIRVDGVSGLRGGEYAVIPDRIEAGTLMIAAAITRGDVVLENVISDHLRPVIAKLREAGVSIEEAGKRDGGGADETGAMLRVSLPEGKTLKTVDLKTMPYPGFPTDMQAQAVSLLIFAEGTSLVTETVFENRFMHIGELKRMGADIKIEGRSAVIEGVKTLAGAQVKATDLRAGAALVLASLRAEGVTEISEIHHIRRGYDGLEEKLYALGARIKTVEA